MRLRRGLQVLNWIWANLFYLVVLSDNFSVGTFSGASLLKVQCLKWFASDHPITFSLFSLKQPLVVRVDMFCKQMLGVSQS